VFTGLPHGPSVAATTRIAPSIWRRRNHVLDVIGVAGAIDVGVMTVLCLVFHVRGCDRDAAAFSSGALSMESNERNTAFGLFFARTLVIAAVNVVLP